MHDLYKEKLSLLLLMANNSVHQVARNSKIFLLLPYFCLAYLTRHLDTLGFMYFYPPGRAGNGVMWVRAALRGSFSWARPKDRRSTAGPGWHQLCSGSRGIVKNSHVLLRCTVLWGVCWDRRTAKKNLAQFLNMS